MPALATRRTLIVPDPCAVMPVIAMGLAALILGEPLTWMKGIAAGVALLGVALMLTGARQPTSSAPR